MILSRAPLRLPIGGGGTDLPSYYSKYGGFIIGAAINKYIYVSINQPAVDDFIRVKYSKFEQVKSVDLIEHDLVKPALKVLNITDNIEITSIADIPASTGLGSSSTYLVALLTALYEFKRDRKSIKDIVEQACDIEIRLAGHFVGKQDHYMAAYGGITTLDIDTSGNVTVSPVDMTVTTREEFKNSVLLFYTGMARPENTILYQQAQDTNGENKDVISSLHYTKELGYNIRDSLMRGDLEHFGELLYEHWINKKKRSNQISNPKIDDWYNLALQNGAVGGKIMGAGGGGFFMFYVPNICKVKLRKAFKEEGLKEILYDFDMTGARILMNF